MQINQVADFVLLLRDRISEKLPSAHSMLKSVMIYSQTSNCVCIYNLYWSDPSSHCTVTMTVKSANFICSIVTTGCDVQNILTVSSDWKARRIKKPHSHSTVHLAYCWFGVSFLSFSLSHPITARRASKLELVFSFAGKLLQKFPVVWG